MRITLIKFTRLILIANILASIVFTLAPVSTALAKPSEPTSFRPSALLQFTSGNHVLGFSPEKFYLVSLQNSLSVEFVGAHHVMPLSDSPVISQNKPSALSKVAYPNLWDGVDVLYESSAVGVAKSSYLVTTSASEKNIRLHYNAPVNINQDKSLSVRFANGEMRESAPIAWQMIDGKQTFVEASFIQYSNNDVGFKLGGHNPHYAVTIDPTYSWHTFYGSGPGDDIAYGVSVDSSGNVYVVGISANTFNVGATAPINAHSGSADIVVVKSNSSGVYQWHSFYGTAATDIGYGVAVDSSGNVLITGMSNGGFTIGGNAPVNTSTGSDNIVVIKLNGSGVYQWHTFYGGAALSSGNGVGVDSSGNVYVAGYSGATFNVGATAPLNAYTGGTDILVVKTNSSGAYQWHTFYGSTTADQANAVSVDSSGNVYVAGQSDATWGTPVNAHGGGAVDDFVILKLDSSGGLVWNTFIGAGNTQKAFGIALDGASNVYVVGETNAGFNVGATAPINAYTGGSVLDMLVVKLNNSGVYQWHSFHGGTNNSSAKGVSADSSGNIYIAGYSDTTFTVGGTAPVNAFTGAEDLVLLNLNSSGGYVLHSFYGVAGFDRGNAIKADASGAIYVAGQGDDTFNVNGVAPINAQAGSGPYDILLMKFGGASISSTACLPQSSFSGNITSTNGDAYYLNCFFGQVHVVEYGKHFTGAVKITSTGITVCIEVPAGYDPAGAVCFTDKDGGRKDFFIKPKTATTSTQQTTLNGVAVGASGGVFQCGAWTVTIPAGAVPNGSTLKCTPYNGNIPTIPNGLRFFGRIIDIVITDSTGKNLTQFNPPLKLCTPFTTGDVQSVGSENNFVVVTTNIGGVTWQEVITRTEGNQVCGTTDHLTLFELAARTPTRIPTTGDMTTPWWVFGLVLVLGAGVGGVVRWLAMRRRKI